MTKIPYPDVADIVLGRYPAELFDADNRPAGHTTYGKTTLRPYQAKAVAVLTSAFPTAEGNAHVDELPDAVLIRAEAIADQARKVAREFSDASWALDAALSAIRKDKARYRQHNAANPDGGSNYVAGQLAAARQRVVLLLSRLGQPQPFNVA